MFDRSDMPPAVRAIGAIVALALVALLWSVVASTIFLVGTRLMTAKTVPLFQFFTYLRYYGFGQPLVGPWLKIAAAVATGLPLLLFAARVARKGWPGSDRRELHGETRWANRRELMRAGFYAKFGGLYVGRDKAGRHLRFGGPEHVACYAPTGSGKGVGLVIPNCLLYEATLVCLDVKKENWAATAGIREEAGQKVYLFDPLAPDGRTARYNPFSYVRRGTIDAFDDIQRIAQMIFPEAHGQEKFWIDAGRSAFIGAAAFIAETEDAPLTFGEVLRLLSTNNGASSTLERIEARRQKGQPYSEATVQALDDYLNGSADLVNSIRKTVTARLSLWFNPRIDAATAESDFDLRELRNSLHAIYIGVTPDNIGRLRPLLALFFQQLVDLTVRTLPQHDPRAKHQVFLMLDEFPLLGPMPVLADAFAYVRGYGMRLMLIMQSKAQLRDRDLYGPDKASAILDNCGLEVVFGTKDLKLTEELSARLGYNTVEATSRSGPRFWQAFRRDKLSMTNSDQRRAHLLPQEIARLRPDEAILIHPGTLPIRCRRIQYFKDRTFSRLVRRPPDVEPITVEVRLDRGPGQPSGGGNSMAAAASAPTSTGENPQAGSAPPVLHRASSRPKPAKRKTGTTETTPDLVDVAEAEEESGEGLRLPTPLPATLPLSSGKTGELFSSIAPSQSDGLIAAILGTDVDLSGLGLADGKAAVAAIVDATPTVESLTRGRRQAM